jgi:ABC-type antimicrobial peptide transport system permease subunit
VSLALAALGVYGVLSILVASRRQEIGVRLALGASPGGIARQVVADSLLGALPGLGIGIALALIAGRLLESVLIGVTSRDSLTLTLVPATMLATALLAGLLPALRAASVDPAIALRRD